MVVNFLIESRDIGISIIVSLINTERKLNVKREIREIA